MSEVELLYKNAGVEKQEQGYCDWDSYCPYDIDNNCGKTCPYWVEEKPDYPPFTAEKQIAILQLLTQQCDLTISHFGEWEFIHFDGQEPLQITGKDFTETFAKLTNAYWQDLTEQDRTEIADILKG